MPPDATGENDFQPSIDEDELSSEEKASDNEEAGSHSDAAGRLLEPIEDQAMQQPHEPHEEDDNDVLARLSAFVSTYAQDVERLRQHAEKIEKEVGAPEKKKQKEQVENVTVDLDDPAGLRVGARVVAVGLIARKDLNGMSGKIVATGSAGALDDAAARHKVVMANCEGVNIKACNLRVAPPLKPAIRSGKLTEEQQEEEEEEEEGEEEMTPPRVRAARPDAKVAKLAEISAAVATMRREALDEIMAKGAKEGQKVEAATLKLQQEAEAKAREQLAEAERAAEKHAAALAVVLHAKAAADDDVTGDRCPAARRRVSFPCVDADAKERTEPHKVCKRRFRKAKTDRPRP